MWNSEWSVWSAMFSLILVENSPLTFGSFFLQLLFLPVSLKKVLLSKCSAMLRLLLLGRWHWSSRRSGSQRCSFMLLRRALPLTMTPCLLLQWESCSTGNEFFAFFPTFPSSAPPSTPLSLPREWGLLGNVVHTTSNFMEQSNLKSWGENNLILWLFSSRIQAHLSSPYFNNTSDTFSKIILFWKQFTVQMLE